MTRRQVIFFRIFLYISLLLAWFSVKWMTTIGDDGYSIPHMFEAIFIIIGGLVLLVPSIAVVPWYLNIRQLINKDQKIAAPDNVDADFDTDKSKEETNTKHYDLSKLDHTIALMVTGVWGLIAVAFTLGIFAFLLDSTDLLEEMFQDLLSW